MAPTPDDQLAQLTTTLSALEGGLPKITHEAKDAVGGWIDTLSGNEAQAPIAAELRKLQDAIAQSRHGDIADALSTLSEQTKHAAATGTPDVQSMLYQLSDLLKLSAGQVGR